MAPPPVHTPAMGQAAAYLLASQDILRGFLEYIDARPSKYQLRPGERPLIMEFLLNLDRRPRSPEESRIRTKALGFFVVDGQLHKLGQSGEDSRRYVEREEAFRLIIRTHDRLCHAGYRKTWEEIDEGHYGIPRHYVLWITNNCLYCLHNQPTPPVPIQPNVSARTFERVQIDLVDMSAEPDGEYKWILHAKDHYFRVQACMP